eukprot:6920257-Karenia_brevis.AAC.1
MLPKLRCLPGASSLILFVQLFYGEASEAIWQDAELSTHTTTQGDGGEQGDPLMPAFFCLGLRDSLATAYTHFHSNEC